MNLQPVPLTRASLREQVTDDLDPEVALAHRRTFADEWVREQLLYQEAEAAGLADNARLQRLIEQARREWPFLRDRRIDAEGARRLGGGARPLRLRAAGGRARAREAAADAADGQDSDDGAWHPLG